MSLIITRRSTPCCGAPSYVSSDLDLVSLYGIEWTDSEGHANIWAPQAYDYSAIWATNENKDPDTAIALSHQQGALFSYNHPASRDPWTLATSPKADCVEIWNSVDDYNYNFEATFKRNFAPDFAQVVVFARLFGWGLTTVRARERADRRRGVGSPSEWRGFRWCGRGRSGRCCG